MRISQDLRNLTWSTALLVFTYIAFVSCSKEEEPEPEPPKLTPEITGISPGKGFVGMHVVIEGKNFSKVPEENAVKIAGVVATVVVADESSIEVIVPAGGTTGAVTVTTTEGTATGPSFTYHDLYLLVNEKVNNGTSPSGNYVKFWRSGIITNISDQTKYYYGNSFAVSGEDVFISGFHFDGQTTHPVYWKNTTVHPLSTAIGIATNIAVSGSDAYVSGFLDNGTHFIAMYWKNESGVELSEGLFSNDVASSIDVSDGNVFVGGALSTSSTSSRSAFWKNGSNETIEEVAGESSNIAGVKVAGQDVHLVGMRYEGSKVYITYWKNGVADDVTNGDFAAAATSISVIESNVYITGYENTSDGKSHGKVWNITTGEVINVTAPAVASIAHGVAKIDGMLVISGVSATNQGQNPFYTVNGEYFPAIGLGANVEIYGIYVK